MTGCQLGFQSQWQLGLKSFFLEALLVSLRNLGGKCFSTLDVVIKTLATRYNINDFGRYQRRRLRDALAWSKPTLIMGLIPSATPLFLLLFHVEPCA